MSRRKPTKKQTKAVYDKGSPSDGRKNWPKESGNTTSSSRSSADKVDAPKEDGTKELPASDKRTGSVINDPEWYSKDNQLVIDAASIPFSEPLGDPINISQEGRILGRLGNLATTSVEIGKGKKSQAVPGILTMYTKASFGFNQTIRSPLNVAAQMLFANIRAKNSGRKNYDAPDIMMYVISMSDIYSYIVWIERLYSKGFMFSQRNKYIGDMLLQSENVDPVDMRKNLANFRYWINTYINKVAAYAVPKDISYFARRVFMYSSVYLENPDANIKDQLYQFSPDGFYRFALDTDGAGMLEYKKLSELVSGTIANTGLTVAQIMEIGEKLFANVSGDEDFGLMSGDIIKAFDGNIISLTPFGEEQVLIPIYSEYVLEQFHNATICNPKRGANKVVWGSGHGSGDVYQVPSSGIIASSECIDYYASSWSNPVFGDSLTVNMNPILDLNTPMPSPIDVMEISRLTAVGSNEILTDDPTDPTKIYCALSCGADIAVSCKITVVKDDYSVATESYDRLSLIPSGTNADPINPDWAANLRVFKYAPILRWFTIANDSYGNVVVNSLKYDGNINNYTVVDITIVKRLHEVAMLSLLSVPGVAKLVNTI